MIVEYRVENFNGTGWDGIRMSQEGFWPVLDEEHSYSSLAEAQEAARQIVESLRETEDAVRVVRRVVPQWSVVAQDETEHQAADLLMSIQRQLGQYVLMTGRTNVHGDLDVVARLSLEAEFAAAYGRSYGQDGQDHHRKLRALVVAMIESSSTPPGQLSPEQIKERNAAYAIFEEGLKSQVAV